MKPDRTDEDLLFQVLIDWGLDLGLPITLDPERKLYRVADDSLVACFSESVQPETVTHIARLRPLRAVFRDSGFGSDDERINAEQIFREVSPETEVRAI